MDRERREGMPDMSFDQDTRTGAWRRAGGKCECTMEICDSHAPGVRCKRDLRGLPWHAHHRISAAIGGDDSVSNLVVMCDPCFGNVSRAARRSN